MLKKVILCALCVMVTLNFAGCNEDGSDNSSANSSTESISSKETEASASDTESQTDDNNNSETSSVIEENYCRKIGVNVFIPENFEEVRSYGDTIYSKEFGNDIIYFAYHSNENHSLSTDQDSYELENVPEIEVDELPDTIYELFTNYESKYKLTVNSETNETIADKQFIKQVGEVHIEYEEPEDTHDFKFIELYTLNTNKYYTKVPTSIILFSDCYDEGTEAEMERLAEEIVTKTEWTTAE